MLSMYPPRENLRRDFGFYAGAQGTDRKYLPEFSGCISAAGLEQRLSVLPEVTLTTSLPYNLKSEERLSAKAEALRFLMKETGIKPAQLMACRDSQNDAAMIRLAGLGIVMKNSSDEMKEIADYVTGQQ